MFIKSRSEQDLEDIEKSKRFPPPPPPPPPRNIKGCLYSNFCDEPGERPDEWFSAIIRTDADNGLPITICREISNGPIGVELGSWLTRFRIVRKMKGGRWELWRCPWIDQERWVRVDDHKLESTGAPDGITIQYVEIHRR